MPAQTVAKEGNLKYALSANDPFIAEVRPGEVFEVEAEINCNAGVITSLDKKLTADDIKLPFVNPATGPIRVIGAKPRRHADGAGPRHGARGPGLHGALAGHRHVSGLGAAEGEFGIQNRVVRVENGVIHWSDRLKLPVRPMIGVAGVAPVHGAVLTIDNGVHGGNLDGTAGTGDEHGRLQRVWDSPSAPGVLLDFWTCAYQAIDD